MIILYLLKYFILIYSKTYKNSNRSRKKIYITSRELITAVIQHRVKSDTCSSA